MSWKDDKNLGTWTFQQQKSKWGYLNNPRWVANPQDPVDYNGSELEEPQIWTPIQREQRVARSTIKHYPCGHWHKIVRPYVPPYNSRLIAIFYVYSYGFTNDSDCVFDYQEVYKVAWDLDTDSLLNAKKIDSSPAQNPEKRYMAYGANIYDGNWEMDWFVDNYYTNEMIAEDAKNLFTRSDMSHTAKCHDPVGCITSGCNYAANCSCNESSVVANGVDKDGNPLPDAFDETACVGGGNPMLDCWNTGYQHGYWHEGQKLVYDSIVTSISREIDFYYYEDWEQVIITPPEHQESDWEASWVVKIVFPSGREINWNAENSGHIYVDLTGPLAVTTAESEGKSLLVGIEDYENNNFFSPTFDSDMLDSMSDLIRDYKGSDFIFYLESASINDQEISVDANSDDGWRCSFALGYWSAQVYNFLQFVLKACCSWFDVSDVYSFSMNQSSLHTVKFWTGADPNSVDNPLSLNRSYALETVLDNCFNDLASGTYQICQSARGWQWRTMTGGGAGGPFFRRNI